MQPSGTRHSAMSLNPKTLKMHAQIQDKRLEGFTLQAFQPKDRTLAGFRA